MKSTTIKQRSIPDKFVFLSVLLACFTAELDE